MKIRIGIVEADSIKPYIGYIPDDRIADIGKGVSLCIGITADDGTGIGAMVVSAAEDPYGSGRDILYVESLHSDDEYRNTGIYDRALDWAAEYAVAAGMAGVGCSPVWPDDRGLDEALGRRFTRIEDGNTIYEVPVAGMIRHPIVQKDYHELGRCITAVSDLNAEERAPIIDADGSVFPKGLSIRDLPGRWIQAFSYVYRKGHHIVGYILSSVLADGKLYVGALHVNESNSMATAALIGRLGRDVSAAGGIKRVMFAAATEDSCRLCDKLIKDVDGAVIRQIRNYYLAIENN